LRELEYELDNYVANMVFSDARANHTNYKNVVFKPNHNAHLGTLLGANPAATFDTPDIMFQAIGQHPGKRATALLLYCQLDVILFASLKGDPSKHTSRLYNALSFVREHLFGIQVMLCPNERRMIPQRHAHHHYNYNQNNNNNNNPIDYGGLLWFGPFIVQALQQFITEEARDVQLCVAFKMVSDIAGMNLLIFDAERQVVAIQQQYWVKLSDLRATEVVHRNWLNPVYFQSSNAQNPPSKLHLLAPRESKWTFGHVQQYRRRNKHFADLQVQSHSSLSPVGVEQAVRGAASRGAASRGGYRGGGNRGGGNRGGVALTSEHRGGAGRGGAGRGGAGRGGDGDGGTRRQREQQQNQPSEDLSYSFLQLLNGDEM
jgi:hypothetical protein